jgi:hypothetical protein
MRSASAAITARQSTLLRVLFGFVPVLVYAAARSRPCARSSAIPPGRCAHPSWHLTTRRPPSWRSCWSVPAQRRRKRVSPDDHFRLLLDRRARSCESSVAPDTVPRPETLSDRDPATGDLLARVTLSATTDVSAAVRAARQADGMARHLTARAGSRRPDAAKHARSPSRRAGPARHPGHGQDDRRCRRRGPRGIESSKVN